MSESSVKSFLPICVFGRFDQHFRDISKVNMHKLTVGLLDFDTYFYLCISIPCTKNIAVNLNIYDLGRCETVNLGSCETLFFRRTSAYFLHYAMFIKFSSILGNSRVNFTNFLIFSLFLRFRTYHAASQVRKNILQTTN